MKHWHLRSGHLREDKAPDLPGAPAYMAAALARRFARNSSRVLPGRRARMLVTVCALAGWALTGCSAIPEAGFSFASSGNQSADASSTRSTAAHSQASFAKGNVTLVAPRGYCIDSTTLRQDASGGFALLPRCNFLQGSSWFGRNRAAVITATIGKTNAAAAPSTADLARTAEGAKLLYYDDKGLLPLVRLQWQGHSVTGSSGASADHWRGAFVLNDHLVVLGLYAPEGSELLGHPGADLLTEMTRRSLHASRAPRSDAAPSAVPLAKKPVAAKQPPGATTRPKSRPETQQNSQIAPLATGQNAAAMQGNSAAATPPAQKRSLRKRIAAIFQ
ncbi:hypothetical protein [Pseudophaeobacter leonis]|uniref:hypothetical protein n=1 Tax=Pseudophaeobacter leonis TaxID=1144477 RepID=UPI0009F3FC58|nr:hypothetical protein [Pseudophaeobacter leonis]